MENSLALRIGSYVSAERDAAVVTPIPEELYWPPSMRGQIVTVRRGPFGARVIELLSS